MLAPFVCIGSVLSLRLSARQNTFRIFTGKNKGCKQNVDYVKLGFIKGELCQKNLISYQSTLIGFPGKGNMADLSGYQQSI